MVWSRRRAGTRLLVQRQDQLRFHSSDQQCSKYYADYWRIGAFDALHDQQQQIFAVIDLNVSPKREINIGVGAGPTAGTNHLIVKGILGRRFNWERKSEVE